MTAQPPVTAKELNQRYQEYWKNRSFFFRHRMADPKIAAATMQEFAQQSQRRPFQKWKPLETICEEVVCTQETLSKASKLIKNSTTSILELIRNTTAQELGDTQSDRGRKGGKSLKTDSLQEWIEKIVKSDLNIRWKYLYKTLVATKDSLEFITDIDEQQIHYLTNKKIRTAPISGLKDRLSRTKKKISKDSR